MNKVIRNSMFGLVGILVVWQLYVVIASITGKLLLYVGLVNKTIYIVGYAFSFIAIIVGFIVGIRAANKKKVFYNIFQPNNQNMLAALLLSALLLTYTSLVKGIGIHTFFVIKILVKAILFYPFAALALYAYNNWDKKPIKQYKTFIVLMLILLSPVALAIGSGINTKFQHSTKFTHYNAKLYNNAKFFHYNKFSHNTKFYNSAKTQGCGAYVYGFPEMSPAEEAGIQVGEIIKEINGNEIKTLRDIKDITYPLTEETEINITTDKGSYEVTTYYDGVKGKQRAGINVWQQTCGSKYRHGFKKSIYK